MAAVIDSEYWRGRAAASHGMGGSGGNMTDDILKRVGVLERFMAEVRAILPTLATKEALAELRGSLEKQIAETRGTLAKEIADTRGTLAREIADTRGALGREIAETRGALETKMNAMETRLITWFIGTAATLTSLAFIIARYVDAH